MHDFAHDERRPTTPTGPSSGAFKSSTSMRALNTNQPVQGTFFEDATPVDRTRAHGTGRDQLRDSHDLSFADGATVRDSVVDNMLLSLDQFSTGSSSNMFGGSSNNGGQFGQYGQDDSFLRDNSFRQPGTRHRGHTYTSSRSSDYDLHPDESTRFAANASHGRRSNSSHTIGLPMSRKGSAREPLSGRQQNGPYGQYQQAGHLRGNSTKGSKGSGSSSMDFGTSGVLGNHRLGFGKRSASFDHSNFGDRSRSSPVKMESVLDRGRTAYQNYADDYDAAPEPTIPAGPRRIQEPPQSPIYLPQPPFAPPPAPGARRRGSVRSNTSYKTLRKNKSQMEPNMRAQAQEFVNASTLRDLPPVPSIQDAAPSPSVNTRKGFFPQQTQAATPKERPGFFRRVFGGGSSKSQTQLSNTSSVSYSSPMESPASNKQAMPDIDSIYSQARPRTTPSNQSHIANQLKNMPKSQQSGTQTQKDQTPSTPAAITKKPSSFFRRRKKSMSENTKPPVMALDFTPPPKPVTLPQQSPGVSSLRKVMNPYLHETGRAGDNFYDARDHETTEDSSNNERPQGFSPGYRPHKDATVRTVKKGSRGEDRTPPSSRGDQVMLTHLASPDSPKMKLKVKNGKATKPMAHEDTFLADSSSCNEDRSGRESPLGERSGAEETRRPSTCPTPSSAHQSGSEGKNDPVPDRPTELLGPATANKQTTKSPSGGAASQSVSEAEDEGWLRTQPSKSGPSSRNPSPAAKRVWIDTTTGEDGSDDLKLPLEGARASQKSLLESTPVDSPNDVFHSATSLPIVQVESRDSDNMPSIVEDRSTHNEPTDGERARALQIFTGDDSAAQKAQAAAILGDVTLSSMRTRKAFMDLFDWAGFNILGAMRDMCGKIVLKAETQQVDRILMSLSERWCECNPHHGFKAVDVVHTVCYSILLLNTDLHMADIESRMTRSQFVKNTLPTVTRVCQDAVKAAGGETLRPNSTHFRRPSLPWNDKSEPTSPSAEAISFPAEVTEETPENRRTRSRLSLRPPIRSASEGILSSDSGLSESNMLVNAPYNGPMKGWEFQVEMVLKDFYESIRKQRLPLHGAAEPTLHPQASNNNLSVTGMLRRTPSMLSKTPSDNASYRGRSQGDFRSVGNRWTSKNRSRKNLYPSSTVASSRTSLDDGSVWSPAGSSTWSRYSYGKTGTSMSMDSLGTHFAAADYQQAIGFANALSQAIIREEGMTIASDEEFSRVAPLLEDETLELVGAPWAKEGILKHKRHLDSVDKKAKDRAWTECFAVVEKGYMRLFSFSMNSKSTRHKKTRPSAGGVVGGGNWMDNAEALDSFPLRQTIASALPPPGYSKTRPHVFALSLPNGAVHLFQVGTPDIVREFVGTTNYWSARLSKEPLTGGVSSMEYGWGENVINPALIRQDSSPSVQGHMPRPSVTSSLRSSMDHATGTPKARLPGDKITLSDWSPPPCSMMASSLMEVDQLRALIDYVKNIEAELGYHNELRAPLLITFSPRHPNAARAMANWERKSQYLLREIVKFRTYIDTLTAAQVQKQKIYAEREALEQELESSEADGMADAGARVVGEDGAKLVSRAIPSQPVH